MGSAPCGFGWLSGRYANVCRSVWESASTTGGSASSLENNNVFGIEPQMYLTTGEKLDDSSGAVGKVDPATLAITTVAVAIIAVVGTATCLYYENLIGAPPQTLPLDPRYVGLVWDELPPSLAHHRARPRG